MSHRSALSKSEDGKSDGGDQFTEILGLKDLSVEKAIQNAKNDIVVEDMMA